MTIPTLDAIKALNGRIYSMLSDDEINVLDFYRKQGRKYDVSVNIINKADPDELARANSQQQADQIMKSANSRIEVTLGSNADIFWASRQVNCES